MIEKEGQKKFPTVSKGVDITEHRRRENESLTRTRKKVDVVEGRQEGEREDFHAEQEHNPSVGNMVTRRSTTRHYTDNQTGDNNPPGENEGKVPSYYARRQERMLEGVIGTNTYPDQVHLMTWIRYRPLSCSLDHDGLKSLG